MNLVFAGYKEGYCVFKWIYIYKVLVWLGTFTGVNWIHCLDRITVPWIFLDIRESGFTAFWDIVHML